MGEVVGSNPTQTTIKNASVVELVDTLDLGSSACNGRESSNLSWGTSV